LGTTRKKSASAFAPQAYCAIRCGQGPVGWVELLRDPTPTRCSECWVSQELDPTYEDYVPQGCVAFMRFEGTSAYVATDDLRVAVNAAIALERPLLVKGEPGTGKTVLALEIAKSL